MALGVNTETARGEGFPKCALVGAGVPVGVSLDKGITRSEEGRVARLERERVDEEVKEDDVALSLSRIKEVGGKAVGGNEGPVDVDESVCPDLANVVNFSESLQ